MSNNLTKDFIDHLIDNIALSAVIEKKVQLKQKGSEFQGLCPFHNEKTPSFTVNNQKNFYYCFGCGAKGNAINFIIETERLPFVEAVEYLASAFAIKIPQKTRTSTENQDNKIVARQVELAQYACKFFANQLWEYSGENALKYLENRGFTKEFIKNYSLGFAPNQYRALTNYLEYQGFSKEEMTNSGLISNRVASGNSKDEQCDKFRNRIIFPIINTKKQVIAFGGRSITGEMPKYLNSAENIIFKKRQTLYNLPIAQPALKENDYLLAVEGYIDSLTLNFYGINNNVACLGTAITTDHLTALFRYSNNIVFCLDGDFAGIKAAERIIDNLLEIITPSKQASFIFLPNGLDPDDFLRKFGKTAFLHLVTQQISLSQACWHFAVNKFIDPNLKLQSFVTAEIKAQIEQDLLTKIEKIKSKQLKKHFYDFFRKQLFYLGNFKPANNPKERTANNSFSQKNLQQSNQLQSLTAILPQYQEIIASIDSKNFGENLNKEQQKRLTQSLKILTDLIILTLKFPQLIDEDHEYFSYDNLSLSNDIVASIFEQSLEVIIQHNQRGLATDSPELIARIDEIFIEHKQDKIGKYIYGILPLLSSDNIELVSKKFYLLILQDSLLKMEEEFSLLIHKQTTMHSILQNQADSIGNINSLPNKQKTQNSDEDQISLQTQELLRCRQEISLQIQHMQQQIDLVELESELLPNNT